MRRYDKIYNINRSNILNEHRYLTNKFSNLLIYETFKSVLTESDELDIEQINKVINNAGGDHEDKDIQLAFLSKMIDADFDMNAINVKDVINKDIQEQNQLNESGGESNILHMIHTALSYLEKSEDSIQCLDKISKLSKGKIVKNKIIDGLHLLEKIINLIPNILSKFIYNMLRKFGAGLETSKMGSIGGDIIWLMVLGGFAIVFFPTLSSIIAGGFAIMKLASVLYKIWNVGKNIFTLAKKVLSGINELTNTLSPVDFLQAIEDNTNTKTKFKYDIVTGFDEWYNHLDDEHKKNANEKLQNVLELIKGHREMKAIQVLKYLNIPEKIVNVLITSIHNKPN